MRILCLDTSGGSAVALVDAPTVGATTVLGSAVGTDPRRHAESLAPLMAQVLAEAEDETVDVVAVGTGPAPFTGLRAGLVTALAFGRGRGIDVHGVCSLDVLARQALDVLADGAEVLVTTDARRKEVYWARYRADGADDVERLAGPEVGTAEVTATANRAEGRPAPAVAGAGAALYPAHLTATPGMPAAPDPAVLARLVRSRLARRATGGTVELGTEPRYLRRPDVQLPGTPRRVS